jgi:outer membrane protein assembly factor BamB
MCPTQLHRSSLARQGTVLNSEMPPCLPASDPCPEGGLLRSTWLFCLAVMLPLAAAAQAPGTKLWELDLGGEIHSSPALGSDGTIYVAATANTSAGGYLAAISPEGERRWKIFTGGAVDLSSPCVGPDDTIYLGNAKGQLLSISPSGHTNWIFKTGELEPVSSPALGVDGSIYIRAYGMRPPNDRLFSVSPEGGTNWQVILGQTPSSASPFQMSSPAVGPDGTIYVTSGNSKLYAISPSGATNWTYALGAPTCASPAVGPDGTVYIGADDNFVYAIGSRGTLKWRYPADGFVESSAAVGLDGSIYVGYYKVGQGGLLALTSTGERRWSFDPGAGVSASPAIDAAGNVYVKELTSFWFRAVDPSGSNIWSFATGEVARNFSSAVIGLNGVLYVGSGTKLYALACGSPLMQSEWPMFRGGPQHTARALQRGIQCSSPRPDGSMDLLLRTEVNREYQVERSTNLADWPLLQKFKATHWNSTLAVPGGGPPQEFYRLQSPSR